MDKREQIKKYFKPFPTSAVWLIILGVPLIAAFGLGIILIIIGLAQLAGSKRPSDQQMDAWIEEDLNQAKEKALEKTGLDKSELVSDTVFLTGLRFWNIGGAEIGIRKGNDNVIRATPIGVTVINFTEDQLMAYQCALDLMTGNSLSDSTEEYFYRDIVSVSTRTESMSWDEAMLSKAGLAKTPIGKLIKHGKLQFNAANTFVLTTSGGTSIEVVLDDPTLIDSMGGGSIPTDRANKAMHAVRKMLREKKVS